MKKNKTKLIIFLIVFILCIISFAIGTFFVNYALVPDQGGQDRQVEDGPLLLNEESIEKNRQLEDQALIRWLSEVQPLTKTVSIHSTDGYELNGHMVKQAEESKAWVIIVHGYQSTEEDAIGVAPKFYQEGYNILSMDLRAHGNSQGDYIGMGYLDSKDLIQWTNFLIEQYPESEIVYHGTSMGAATVLLASGQDLPDNVKVIIEDCGYSGVYDIFASELDKRFGLPSFPILDIARLTAYFQAGYDIKAGDVTKAVSQNYVPTLFIHGQEDDFVPVSMAYELFEANAGSNKDLLIIEHAGHGEAKYADPQTYYEKIFNFIQKNIHLE